MLRKFVMPFVAAITLLTQPMLFAMPKITFTDVALESSKQIILLLGEQQATSGDAKTVNDLTGNRLSEALKATEFNGKFGDSVTFYGLTPYSQVTVVGTGSKQLSQSQLQDLGGVAAAALPTGNKVESVIVASALQTEVKNSGAYLALGVAMRDYHFDKYKKASSQTEPRKINIQSLNSSENKKHYEADLKHLAEGIYIARDMAWEPGNSVYPELFVERVKKAFKGVKNVDIDVLDIRDMEKLNMGALLGVGKGSIHDPRLLVINYKGGKGAPLALVGKGITFDTGGISLKKNDGMWAMKSDLSGAAAVAGTMLAVAKRGEKINLVGLMPLAENMPAEDAIRPGDVLTTMQGTTIEIMSTDAEGRLILADAVRYAQDTFKPKMLLNIATLTGSAARALSDEYAALITRDWELNEKMMEVGKLSGEEVWPLPLHPNHYKQLKSQVADIKNSGVGSPGASIGAAVVGTFIDEDLPWVHLDIAGVDWLDKSTHVAPAGAHGWGVRFMDQLVRSHAQ